MMKSLQPFAECPEANKLTGPSFREAISGKQGIIFFKDYWNKNRHHIDLWGGNELASIGAIITFIRGTFPDISEKYFNMSDLTKSSEVLLWDMSG